MNITRENIDELNGLIRVSIVKDDYEANVEQVLKDYRKKANMPGFRPGKVPQGLIKKMYGKAALVDEVNKLLSQELSKYLVEEKLDILGEPLPSEEKQPEIDWEKDADFEFVFDIGFAPEANISLDKRKKLPFYNIKVTKEMIDQQVEAYAMRFGANEDTELVEEKGTVRGDIAQLDAEGNLLENGKSVDMALISVDVIKDDEIKKEFIGKKVGDEVVFDIKKAYPNNTEIAYLLNVEKTEAESIEGNFRIAIKEVHKFVPAKLNEDLYKKIYGEETTIKTEKEFRQKVKEEIDSAFKPSGDYKFAIDTRDFLIEKVKMDFPEEFLKRWLLATNKELTKEKIDEEFEAFMTDLRWQVIKEKIIKENELKVEEEELKQLAREVALAQFRQYGMFEVPAEHLDGFAKQMLDKQEDRSRLFNRKMEDKIMEVVKGKVTLDEKEVSREEFDKMFEKA
ncbi:MAG: trigger factor [Prolixibacteraceae bacterium]|nr:trigger factor [Prolixibacteraceae bacterium]